MLDEKYVKPDGKGRESFCVPQNDSACRQAGTVMPGKN
jgi:hypothetical protein